MAGDFVLGQRVTHVGKFPGSGTVECIGTTFEAHAEMIGDKGYQSDFEFDQEDVVDVLFDNGERERFIGQEIGWLQ
jgi:hypothetical protein